MNNLKTKIKSNIIPIIILLSSFFLIIIHGYCIYYYACIRDEYSPVDEILSGILLFALILSILLTIIINILIIRNKMKIASIVFICLISFSGYVTLDFYRFQKDYPINLASKNDYIENEWLQGILLKDIESYTTSKDGHINILYVGKDNDSSCQSFEEKIIKQSKKISTCLPTYYTNLDENHNKKKLNQFLKKYSIESIPTLIVTDENGKLLEKATNKEKAGELINKYWDIN